ncbi:MAG TPA: hypothetical protein P5558_02545 [Geminicoccaceae bacterium]|nr:hypothetical protein [Geminicoccaceae bacterium]
MASKRALIGIDVGTSGTKVLVVDEAGAILARHTESYPLDTPRAIPSARHQSAGPGSGPWWQSSVPASIMSESASPARCTGWWRSTRPTG